MFWAIYRQQPVASVGAYQPGLQLFLVCRQLYHEASSVFYENNTFTISRNCTRWDHVHDAKGDYLANVALAWLTQLGSRAHMLRKIELDLDSLCPATCPRIAGAREDIGGINAGLINVLPLLKLEWAGKLQAEMKVVHPCNQAHKQCVALQQANDFGTPLQFDISGDALTAAIRCSQRDDLNLKKYHRTLAGICLKRDGSGGIIAFLSTTNQSNTVRAKAARLGKTPAPKAYLDGLIPFSIEGGNQIRLAERKPAALLNLPEHLRYRILKHSLTYAEVQKISIDNESNIRDALGPLYVNFDIPRSVYSHYATTSRFVIEIKHISELPRLNRLLWDIDWPDRRLEGGIDYSSSWPDLGRWFSVQINLSFSFAKASTVMHIENAQFNTMPFLHATLRASGKKDITISLRGPDGNDESNDLSLWSLRRQVLLAWTNNLGPQVSVPQGRCPEIIWVSGRGDVMEIVAAPPTPVAANDDDESDEDMMEEDTSNFPAESSMREGAFMHCLADRPLGTAPAWMMFRALQKLCKDPYHAVSEKNSGLSF